VFKAIVGNHFLVEYTRFAVSYLEIVKFSLV